MELMKQGRWDGIDEVGQMGQEGWSRVDGMGLMKQGRWDGIDEVGRWDRSD